LDFDNDNSNIIALDLPMRDSRGLAGLFLRYYSTFAALICDTKLDTDYRIEMFTTLMISSIPDDDIRAKLRELKEALIKERTAGIVDVGDRNRIITKTCLEVVGDISAYMDLYLGTSKKISVSIEAAYPEGNTDA